MKPSLKKVNSELLRKAIVWSAKHHILNDCPLKLDICPHQAEIDATKTAKQELDICSHCWLDWLFKESEV